MVYRAIHRDVKIAAIQLFERQLLPLNDILLCCGFSRRTFFRILKIWRETGDVIIERVMYGRYRSLHQTDIHYLLTTHDRSGVRQRSKILLSPNNGKFH